MRLQLLSWCEVEKYLEQRNDIIIPIGSTEQHSYQGLIGTDAICPEVVAHSFGEKHGVLIGPTLPIGVAQHHMGFPGSMTLRPLTFINTVLDVIDSANRHGFQKIHFFNGHGGNIAPLNTAFAEAYANYSLQNKECPFKCMVSNWFLGKRVGELSDKYFPGKEGRHATPSEISLTYFAYPEAIKAADRPLPESADGSVGIHDAGHFRKSFPDGRIESDPRLATKEIGKELHLAAQEDLLEVHREFIGI